MIKNLCKLLVMVFLLTGVVSATEYTQVHAEHIDNGGNFEAYARAYSLCPSGRNGGDLGYFGHGQMVKEFEKAAFATPIGQVSNPVYTQFGWHLIKVLDKE